MRQRSTKTSVAIAAIVAAVSMSAWSCHTEESAQQRANRFLAMYNSIAQKIYAVSGDANWKASTDVTEQHVGERIGADRAAR